MIVFGLWAIVTVFWQNLWQVAKSEFQVSSAELWENMIKLIHTINIFFRTLGEFFSDFGKKNSQVCRNSNLSVHMKNVEKNSWTIGFSSFLEYDKKNLYFYTKVFGRVVKTTFYVSRGTLSEQTFWKEVLKTSGLSDNFWSFRDNGGKHFQGWRSSKRCPGEQPKEKVFLKRESFDFLRFWAIFLLLAKYFARFAKPAIWECHEVIGGNHFFKYI